MLDLSTPVTRLHMVGLFYANKLKKLEIDTVGDLLYHIPFRYQNYSIVSKINLLQVGETVTISGKIADFKNIYTKRGKKIQKAKISDETGTIDIVWYNQPFLKNIIRPGVEITIAGEVKMSFNKLILQSPEYELSTPNKRLVHTARLVPIYPETAGVSSKWLRSRISAVLTKFSPDIKEFLPKLIIDKYGLLEVKQAIYNVHFPKSLTEAQEAKKRLAFDELFLIQLYGLIKKREREKELSGKKLNLSKYLPKLNKFINSLPFTLTKAQKKAIDEITIDLSKQKPMNRLLEGDVGSGKTIVAAVAMYLSYLNGYQSILMAPTEILADQHQQTISRLLSPLGVKTSLISRSTKTAKTKVELSKSDVLIGTHALLSKSISTPKLALAIIDEQQRFGVEQRALLRSKSDKPHVLTMTATPIPRTVALTLYADLDLSVLDQMPIGRLKPKTWVVPPFKREAAYNWIRRQIKNKTNNQVFIICPFIEESETLASVKSATKEYDNLQKNIYPDLKLGLVHGRMKAKDKNKIIADFKNGKCNLLVATPVVEVGIDIPLATIIMIEGAERFGLAQLHQLRGRVGRGSVQSYCLLFTESDNATTIKRLKFLETTNIGIKLAEFDLKMRGPGQLYGTKQHGDMGLKIADFSDLPLIHLSREAANSLIHKDSSLKKFPSLLERLQKYTVVNIAPD